MSNKPEVKDVEYMGTIWPSVVMNGKVYPFLDYWMAEFAAKEMADGKANGYEPFDDFTYEQPERFVEDNGGEFDG